MPTAQAPIASPFGYRTTAREAISGIDLTGQTALITGAMNKGFTVDTKGLTAPITFTPDNHTGPVAFRMLGYDFGTKKYKPFGEFSDYVKYIK